MHRLFFSTFKLSDPVIPVPLPSDLPAVYFLLYCRCPQGPSYPSNYHSGIRSLKSMNRPSFVIAPLSDTMPERIEGYALFTRLAWMMTTIAQALPSETCQINLYAPGYS